MHWSKATHFRKLILDHIVSNEYDFVPDMAQKLKISRRTIYRHITKLLFEGKISIRNGIVFLKENKQVIDGNDVYKRLDISLGCWKKWKKLGLIKMCSGGSVIPVSNIIQFLNKIRVGTPISEIPNCIKQIEVMRLLGKHRNEIVAWTERGLPYFIYGHVILFSKQELANFLHEYIANPPHHFNAKKEILKLEKALNGLNMPKP